MMNTLRGATIVGAAALLVSLAGCSAATSTPAAAPVTPAPAVAPVPTPSPTPPPAPAPAAQPVIQTPPACAGTPAGTKQIYVSIGQQHLWACDGAALFIDAPVTTGASALKNVDYATPLGTSRITAKVRNTVLRGKDIRGPWNDPVAYWMPFNGGDGFHDASWQTFPLGSPLYTTEGSHGCVHVALNVVAAVFDWAPVGTRVTVKA
jgi:lipoprotein-anchoring transpeptidase ErfK/SrfK